MGWGLAPLGTNTNEPRVAVDPPLSSFNHNRVKCVPRDPTNRRFTPQKGTRKHRSIELRRVRGTLPCVYMLTRRIGIEQYHLME